MQKAVLLAAGRGTRMGELTRQLPKPLLPLHGRPMILHILDRLQAAGVTDVLLVTGFEAELMESTAAQHPLGLSFIRQTEINGTGAAARLASQWCAQDRFLLTFGDILAESAHYTGMLELAKNGAEAILAARHVPDPHQGAAIYTEANGRIERIVEKPPIGTSTTNWNSAGIYVCGPSLFTELDRIPLSPRGEYELTSAFTQMLEQYLHVHLFPLDGNWLDVGRPEDLSTASQIIAG
jgi:UDP-N-acetylglucosamine diphosphorylase / glucose-1-phosphate thymidylyltransferase / UDP-N-acetylgalactosamine diphosphorylase / glucosamine-1-phosphate N-acetyltransferase / galactosamine-1-phosphate N-acetyltransferase